MFEKPADDDGERLDEVESTEDEEAELPEDQEVEDEDDDNG